MVIQISLIILILITLEVLNYLKLIIASVLSDEKYGYSTYLDITIDSLVAIPMYLLAGKLFLINLTSNLVTIEVVVGLLLYRRIVSTFVSTSISYFAERLYYKLKYVKNK